jgi:hypothetical protein
MPKRSMPRAPLRWLWGPSSKNATPQSMRLPNRPILLTLCATSATVAIFGQRGFAFMLVLPVLIWLVWLLVNLWKIIRHPQQRATRAICIGVWLLAFGLIACIHDFHENRTRERANAIVAQIKTYQAQHNQYPTTLDVLGISKAQLGDELGLQAHYFNAREYSYQRPNLTYPSSYSFFDRYSYQFDSGEWKFVPD